jgi:hypothetical protein
MEPLFPQPTDPEAPVPSSRGIAASQWVLGAVAVLSAVAMVYVIVFAPFANDDTNTDTGSSAADTAVPGTAAPGTDVPAPSTTQSTERLSATSADPVRVDGPLVPSEGVLMGAYVEASDSFDDLARRQDVRRFEEQIGRQLDLSHDFYAWEHDFKPAKAMWNIERGVVPFITWFGGEASLILAGEGDERIRAQARLMGQLPSPFFLRYHHEPDGQRSAELGYGGDLGAERYVQAWQRVHRIFAEEGVTNAVWVWNTTSSGFEDGRAAAYYPGDDWVDWIGVDPYLWNPCGGEDASTLATKLAPFLQWAESVPKPIVLGEWGAGHGDRTNQADFISSAADLAAEHPNVAALVYFNTPGKAHEGWCRWTVEEHPLPLDAFRDLVGDPAHQVDLSALRPALRATTG